MNKRIEKLAEQAWDKTAVSRDFGHPVAFAEILAKLVVQECADYIRTHVDHDAAEIVAFRLEVDFGLHGDYA